MCQHDVIPSSCRRAQKRVARGEEFILIRWCHQSSAHTRSRTAPLYIYIPSSSSRHFSLIRPISRQTRVAFKSTIYTLVYTHWSTTVQPASEVMCKLNFGTCPNVKHVGKPVDQPKPCIYAGIAGIIRIYLTNISRSVRICVECVAPDLSPDTLSVPKTTPCVKKKRLAAKIHSAASNPFEHLTYRRVRSIEDTADLIIL